MTAHFDPYAEEYDQALAQGISISGEDKNYFADGRVSWLRRCLVVLKSAPKNIMDYGCGIGTSVPFLLKIQENTDLVGLDLSEKSLEVARKSFQAPNVSFQNLNEYKPEEKIDLVYSNGVFHHIPPAERSDAVKYVGRSLKPGGLFALWENNPWNPGTRYVMRTIPFDRGAIALNYLEAKEMLTKEGFEVLRTDFLFYIPNFLRALRFIEPYLRKVPFGGQYQVLARKMANSKKPNEI